MSLVLKLFVCYLLFRRDENSCPSFIDNFHLMNDAAPFEFIIFKKLVCDAFCFIQARSGRA